MRTKPEARGAASADKLGVCVGFLVLLAVATHPTQAALSLPLDSGSRQLNLSPVDLILAAAFLLWVVRRIVRREFRLPPLYPATVAAALWLVLSLVPQLKGSADLAGGALKLGLVKAAQFVEYFLVAHILFVETFSRARYRRLALRLLACVTAVAVAAAVVQYCSGDTGVLHVRGSWFDNRNTFGAFLAIVLPLLFGTALFERSRAVLAAISLLVIAGLCVCLSGGAFVAICAGLLVAAALRGRTAFAAVALALVVLVGLVLPGLPRRNGTVLLDSVALYKQSDPNRLFNDDVVATASGLSSRQAALAKKVAAGEPVDYGDLVTEQDYSWKWQQRYKEWQAALNVMIESPWFGVGAGAYQTNVNRFYQSDLFGAMPKYPKNLLEADTLNGYLVLGASAGAPFLILLAAMFLRAARCALPRFADEECTETRGLTAGVISALAALAVAMLFTNPLVRGVGVTLALLLALAQTIGNHTTTGAHGSSEEGAAP